MRLIILLACAVSAFGQTLLQQNYDARTYAWSRTNGLGASGDLSAAGAGKTITVTPPPKGVYGSSSNHYVYISDGTGTAEAALITGGTCSASSIGMCSIIVTTANTHTGAWKVGTATAGVQEAIHARSAGRIAIPSGTYDIYGTVYVTDGTWLAGDGRAATTLRYVGANNAPMIYSIADHCKVSDMTLTYAGASPAAAGCYGVHVDDDADAADDIELDNLQIGGFYHGIRTDQTSGSTNLSRILVNNSESHGILVDNTQGKWNGIQLVGNKGDGIHGGSITLEMQQMETFGNGGWGFNIDKGLQLVGFYVNNDSLGCIQIDHASVYSGYMIGGKVEYCGDNLFEDFGDPAYARVLNAPGIKLVNGPMTLTNIWFFSNNGNALEVSAQGVVASGLQTAGDGAGLQVGYMRPLLVTGSEFSLSNSRIGIAGDGSLFSGGNAVITGSRFTGNSASSPVVEFPNNGVVNVTNIFKNNWINQVTGGGTAIATGSTTSFLQFDPSVYSGVVSHAGAVVGDTLANRIQLGATEFAHLSSANNGVQIYCVDCTIASPCAGGGSGAFAKRINGAWICN